MKREKRAAVVVKEARFGIEWLIRGKAEEHIYHFLASEQELPYAQFIQDCVGRGKAVGWEFVRCFVA